MLLYPIFQIGSFSKNEPILAGIQFWTVTNKNGAMVTGFVRMFNVYGMRGCAAFLLTGLYCPHRRSSMFVLADGAVCFSTLLVSAWDLQSQVIGGSGFS